MGFPFTAASALEEHQGYLAASSRLDAYERALREVVTPGAVVLDLGTGTGILGFLALRAGASRVTAVDGGAMAGVARTLLEANGVADRVVVLKGWSRELDLPREYDVIVCDQLNPFALGAGLVDSLADARERFLKPGGVVVPSAVTLEVAPAEDPKAWERVGTWRGAPKGYALQALWPHARNARFMQEVPAEALLGTPAELGTLDLAADAGGIVSGTALSTVERAGTLHGIAGWFRARLSPGVVLTTSPLDPARIARRLQILLPVEEPVAVLPGERVRAKVRVDSIEDQISWTVDVLPPEGEGEEPRFRSVHSDFQGALVEPADLRRLAPSHVPVLTTRGRAMRRALELCAGGATVESLRSTLLAEFPSLLRSPRDVQEVVQEILERYAGD